MEGERPRRFLGREDGTYGPIPRRKLLGLLECVLIELFQDFIAWGQYVSGSGVKCGGVFRFACTPLVWIWGCR